MARLEHYISVGRQRLRCGYTTGTCAAAASRGAAEFLATGQWPQSVIIDTPAGISVELELLECSAGENWASCAVEKDGGDDPDVTHGTLIFARVEKLSQHEIQIDGGIGVGRVTRAGLDQPVGNAAINSVPRKMIAEQLEAVLSKIAGNFGLKAVISVPEGEHLARKTFNPRLGITGGISILGTSGIVRPMSESALIDSIKLELDMLVAAGAQDIILTPGNYGERFSRQVLGLPMKNWATCSNYLGVSIDHAAGLGFRSILLIGHLGKLVKIAAGNFNTHSKVSDGRREVFVTHAALQGADKSLLRDLFDSITSDEAVDLLEQAGLLPLVMESIAQEIDRQLKRRAGENLEIEVMFFSNKFGILGQSPGARVLLLRHQNQHKLNPNCR